MVTCQLWHHQKPNLVRLWLQHLRWGELCKAKPVMQGNHTKLVMCMSHLFLRKTGYSHFFLSVTPTSNTFSVSIFPQSIGTATTTHNNVTLSFKTFTVGKEHQRLKRKPKLKAAHLNRFGFVKVWKIVYKRVRARVKSHSLLFLTGPLLLDRRPVTSQ